MTARHHNLSWRHHKIHILIRRNWNMQHWAVARLATEEVKNFDEVTSKKLASVCFSHKLAVVGGLSLTFHDRNTSIIYSPIVMHRFTSCQSRDSLSYPVAIPKHVTWYSFEIVWNAVCLPPSYWNVMATLFILQHSVVIGVWFQPLQSIVYSSVEVSIQTSFSFIQLVSTLFVFPSPKPSNCG